MKKQTAMVLSFSALLAIGAVAPHILWQADKSAERSPASVESKDLFNNNVNKAFIEKAAPKKEEVAVVAPAKDLEKVEVKVLEVKKVEVDAQVSCLKEKQPADLEAQVKKLMEDKEAIMKELAELKKTKKEEPKLVEKKEDKENKEENKEEKKEAKKIVKLDNSEDVLGIMSQLTNMMGSMQQQQMMMMNQMFSMFQSQMPKQQSSWSSPMSDYMSPYAFNASSFAFPMNQSPYSLGGFSNQIGLNSNFGSNNSIYSRAPSQVQMGQIGQVFDSGFIQSEESFQPQVARPHNGFDFRENISASNMTRVQF